MDAEDVTGAVSSLSGDDLGGLQTGRIEEVIPENIDRMVENLHEYRQSIKGDFEEKVYQLNKLTESLIVKKESNDQN